MLGAFEWEDGRCGCDGTLQRRDMGPRLSLMNSVHGIDQGIRRFEEDMHRNRGMDERCLHMQSRGAEEFFDTRIVMRYQTHHFRN